MGVDGQTADEYAADLEGNLRRLHDRLKSGTYQAPPVRRVRIPKGDGKQTRPIGIPTFEDKVLQRAVAMVLEVDIRKFFDHLDHGHLRDVLDHRVREGVLRRVIDICGGPGGAIPRSTRRTLHGRPGGKCW